MIHICYDFSYQLQFALGKRHIKGAQKDTVRLLLSDWYISRTYISIFMTDILLLEARGVDLLYIID